MSGFRDVPMDVRQSSVGLMRHFLHHPLGGQHLRLLKDGSRRFLLLVGWMVVLAQDAFDEPVRSLLR